MRRGHSPPSTPLRQALRAALPALALVMAIASAAGAVTPGISKIAYTSFRGGSPAIWLVTPNGSGPTRVLPAGSDGDGAALSPDGARIVYESPRRYYAQLYMINTDGTGEHRVLGYDFYGQSGTWSPDGAKIAFTHSSNNGLPGGTGTVWVVNANGTGLKQLSPGGVDDWVCDWSPDGTKISFVSTVAGHGEVFVMDADGTDRQQLTSGTAHISSAEWSPDGTKLACALFPTPGSWSFSSIHVMNADGAGDTAVTDTSCMNARPVWSPDGGRISFHSNRSGCFQIYTMAGDGSDVQRVTWVTSTPGDFNGDWKIVTLPAGVEDAAGGAGLELRVPSPVRAQSSIRFTIPREAETRLEVFDGAGRLVRTLLRQRLGAGSHSAAWDGRDGAGRAVPAGVYHCRLVNGEAGRTARLVVVR